MDCKEFEWWLTRRDIHRKNIQPDALAHMEACDACRRLLDRDSLLEQSITQAFQPEPLPRETARRIDAAIDKKVKSKALTALAALAAGLALAFFLLPHFTSDHFTSGQRFDSLGQLSRNAAAGHLAGNRKVSFSAQQTDQALSMLTEQLGFQVILPAPEQLGFTVLGCRICALNNCKAAYFAVEREGRPGSLFIMDTDHIKFSMDEGIRFNRKIDGCLTTIWKAQGQVYAMVF